MCTRLPLHPRTFSQRATTSQYARMPRSALCTLMRFKARARACKNYPLVHASHARACAEIADCHGPRVAASSRARARACVCVRARTRARPCAHTCACVCVSDGESNARGIARPSRTRANPATRRPVGSNRIRQSF